MNHAYRTAEDWRNLKRTAPWREIAKPALPDLIPCAVTLESTHIATPGEVERIAQGFAAHCGWLERQSRLALVLGDGDWPGPEDGFDAILAGELAGDRASLGIRRVADGWRLTWVGDTPDEAGPFLGQEQRLTGVERLPATGQAFGARLNYRVYWRHDEDLGWRRFAARLLSFE